MKKSKLFSLLAAVCAAAVLFGGCSLFSGKNASSAVPAASFGSSSAQSSEVSSQASSQEAASSSSEISSHSNQPASSQPGPVLTIKTDSEAFNAKFKDNPIDKAYIAESNKAISTVDMVNVSRKYTKVWQKEVDFAWSELQKNMVLDNTTTRPEKRKAEQKAWEDGKTAALKKIIQNAQAGGGSMAEVNAASETMDFYRSRAAQLYRELYDYKKDFSYAYSAD